MDPMVLYGGVALAAIFVLRQKRRKKRRDAHGRPVGTNTRVRIRRSIESIYHEIGDELFRRAYRMTYPTFLELHRLLEPEILRIHKVYQEDITIRRKEKRSETKRIDVKTWKRFVPNGSIPTSTRLAIALRYFAGGSLYDIAPLFGVGRSDALRSVWMVVEAVHRTEVFNLVFPADHDTQRELARQFSTRSQAGFQCCVGAVDGILIWIHKPSPSCCKASKCDASKFFCGRKHKFGLNCQAVADFRGRFLDMSIKYPGSTSDCLAFESSQLFHDLENGLLAEGLCIFGDNAYINSLFLATPYPNVSGGYKDAYNFFHSQLRIRVECAFGMFVQRWGVLRSAVPCGVSIRKTISLVVALGKLHNYCIDQTDTSILPATPVDQCRLMTQMGGFVPLDQLVADNDEMNNNNNEMADDNTTVPTQLLGGGEHFDDVPGEVRQAARRRYNGVRLPRERLAEDIVQENNYRRPRPRGTK
jgi:DDE superfamily endonuclease